MVDALTSHLRTLDEAEATRLLPDDIGILVHLFPVLERSEAVAKAPRGRIDALDQQQIRARAFAAFRLLLGRICRNARVLCFVDDLQWGDEDSAKALFEVLRPSQEVPNIIFLGSYRSDEADDSPFLAEWVDQQRTNAIDFEEREVSVGPLSLEESTQLVVNLLETESGVVRARAVEFHAQTGGNPFLLTELVGCFDPQADSFHATDIHGVLDQKLAQLPEEARNLLDTIAVSGQALDGQEAFAATDLTASMDSVLIAMRNARLVRRIGAKVDTYHDRIRHAVLDRLDEREISTRHHKLAEVIEQISGGLSETDVQELSATGERLESDNLARIYDLAYHWDAAGVCRKALAYGIAAATQARRQSALEVAAEQFSLAERNSNDETPQLARFRIARGKGEALMLLARYEETRPELEKALSLAGNNYESADALGLMGEFVSKTGGIEESMHHFENGIRLLRCPVPKTELGVWSRLTHQVAVQAFHSFFPGRLHRQQPDEVSDLCNKLLAKVEWSYWCNNVPRLLWASFVGINRAERLPKSASLAIQYVCHANDMAVLGWHSRAEKYYLAASRVSEELNDLWGIALAQNHFALGCLATARYEAAVEKAKPGVQTFARLGDILEHHLSLFHVSLGQFCLGNMKEAYEAAQELFFSCVRHSDGFVFPFALYALTRSSLGQIPFDEVSESFVLSRGNNLGSSMTFMASGFWHTHHGRTAEAVESFEQGWQVASKNRCLVPYNSAALTLLVTALREHAEALELKGDSDARPFRKRWLKLASWANRLSWMIPLERPHALRELAIAYEFKGRTQKAVTLISKSCDIAEKQKARYQHAQSLLVKGKLRKKLGESQGHELIQKAQVAIDEIETAARDCQSQ